MNILIKIFIHFVIEKNTFFKQKNHGSFPNFLIHKYAMKIGELELWIKKKMENWI